MPKEVIYSDAPEYVYDTAGNELSVDLAMECNIKGPTLRRGVKLGWTKDVYVEIGCAEFEISTQDSGNSGMFLSLDRQGCNRLIKALQQARNDVFGKDA
jgi:hypothetical protein